MLDDAHVKNKKNTRLVGSEVYMTTNPCLHLILEDQSETVAVAGMCRNISGASIHENMYVQVCSRQI